MRLWLFLFSLIFMSAGLTWILIRFAKKRSMLDIPNHRSAHSIPTPRGGGAALIATFIIGLVAIYLKDVVTDPTFIALIFGGGSVALIGWLDDKNGVSVKVRFLVHTLAAVFAVFVLHEVPELPFQETFPELEYVGYGVALLAIIWSTNLFNFMDGINGLAGIEAFFVSGSAAIILFISGEQFHSASLLVLCFSALGFLIFNFPRAQIFMGDVGSGFLGFLMAVYAIGVSSEDAISPWSWVILYGCFIVDSTITLLTRMITKQRWLHAHNLHAYQKWSRRVNSHVKVTVSILAINILWLFPLALLATVLNDYAFLLTLVALLPICVGVIKLKAGVKEI